MHDKAAPSAVPSLALHTACIPRAFHASTPPAVFRVARSSVGPTHSCMGRRQADAVGGRAALRAEWLSHLPRYYSASLSGSSFVVSHKDILPLAEGAAAFADIPRERPAEMLPLSVWSGRYLLPRTCSRRHGDVHIDGRVSWQCFVRHATRPSA
jgi:hypothetical protein